MSNLIFDFLLKSISYTQYGGGLVTLCSGAVFFEQNIRSQFLPKVDSKIQGIFQDILRECKLNPSQFLCKIDSSLSEAAAAVGFNTILISNPLLKKLNSDVEEDRLFARSTIKHELGHLYYKDPGSLFVIYAVITGIAYTINKLAKNYLLNLPARGVLSLPSLGAFAAFGLGSHFLSEAILLRAERRADDFAIQHTTDPKELLAVRNVYQSCFQRVIDEAKTRYFGGPFWKTKKIFNLVSIPLLSMKSFNVFKEYELTKKPNQSLEEWVIEHRDELPIDYLKVAHHDSVYDLAQKFLKASQNIAQ